MGVRGQPQEGAGVSDKHQRTAVPKVSVPTVGVGADPVEATAGGGVGTEKWTGPREVLRGPLQAAWSRGDPVTWGRCTDREPGREIAGWGGGGGRLEGNTGREQGEGERWPGVAVVVASGSSGCSCPYRCAAPSPSTSLRWPA